MRRRCRPTYFEARYYSERGITVCKRWEVFENFYADMGPKPSPRHTLDRIDNDKGYRPGNCRWSTREEQAQNKRTNRWITHAGRTMLMEHWAKELGMDPAGLHWRLRKWTVAEAITRPIQVHVR
jgi:hypothetical protein